ncbi:MAG: hypothetical protein JXQ23_13815 [Clostridia bacterium]|nr:hypothetical protein [Clostridia bacterium]
MNFIKTLKNLVIYLFFPLGIILFSFRREYLLLAGIIIIYFTVFFLFKKEDIYKMMAGYYDKNKNTNKALKRMYDAYKVKKSSMNTANQFIYLLLKSGKYDKCGEIINEVSNREMKEKDKEILLTNKALYLWKKNLISESISLYEQITENHKSTAVYTAYGYVITLGDDIDKALKLNLEAYEYNKDSKGIMDNLALSYMKAGDLDKSYDLYMKLLEKKPAFPEAYYNMALLMQLKGELTDARYYLGKALELPFNGLSTVSKQEVEKKLDYIKRLQGNLS